MVLMPGLKGKYDAWNRLVEIRDSNDNLIATYEYNGLNQRIKKTVNNVETKSFFNEKWQEIESITNNQVTSYVWGLRYIDDLVLREKDEERLYSLADPNWNVIAICDATGDIQERYNYNAFGKRNIFDEDFTAKTGSEFNWNRTFTGQVLDIETKLILYRERYYEVMFGRFINRDPIEYNSGDVNFYRYVFNMSETKIDPMGLRRHKPIIAPNHSCDVDCVERCKNLPTISGTTIYTAGNPQQNCINQCNEYKKKFNDWYNKNKNITWTFFLPACPCKLCERDPKQWGEPGPPDSHYHIGATNCMRSHPNEQGHANQCCYDSNGDLITSGSGQGSADWSAASWTLQGAFYYSAHKREDMNPADWATFLDGGWGCFSNAYLNVRPQVNPKTSDCE
ncbi:MAG: hypothetical protein LBE12_15740 [Planctomycetaceae bacterium]|jgi:RHS repeat-associated protein|nr:hypothetical protein [Planctomycetaceae bacterium]